MSQMTSKQWNWRWIYDMKVRYLSPRPSFAERISGVNNYARRHGSNAAVNDYLCESNVEAQRRRRQGEEPPSGIPWRNNGQPRGGFRSGFGIWTMPDQLVIPLMPCWTILRLQLLTLFMLQVLVEPTKESRGYRRTTWPMQSRAGLSRWRGLLRR